MASDGELISEIGFAKYHLGKLNQQFSSIKLLNSAEVVNKKWDECKFGCHHPGYRTIHKAQEWYEVLKVMDQIDPVVAGVVDGVKSNTFDPIHRIGHGIKRTGEGLHLFGRAKFQTVSAENLAATELVYRILKSIIEFNLDAITNPIMQATTAIINGYMIAIPEWIIEQMLEQGSLTLDSTVTTADIVEAAKFCIQEPIHPEYVEKINDFIDHRRKRIIGKVIGKKMVAAISVAISLHIAKSILKNGGNSMAIRRQLAKLRQHAGKAGGASGKVLYALLKAQGALGLAARDSRRLHSEAPILWKTLRNELHGADIIYFLIRPFVQEYVDRIHLLSTDPTRFFEMMEAVVKSRKSRSLFFLES